MVYYAEGPGGRLAITDEFAVDRSLLSVQMVAQYLVEALQANAFRFLFLVVADLRSAPDALDLKSPRLFSFLLHAPNILREGYRQVSKSLNTC